MSSKPNTSPNTVGIRPTLRNLRAGDRVLVWCGVSERNVSTEIADIKEVSGRIKIRAAGTNFFFDEALVISFTICRDVEGDEPSRSPFIVAVSQNKFGAIGVITPISHCEQCDAPTRQLFNVGTPILTRFVCGDCRSLDNALRQEARP